MGNVEIPKQLVIEADDTVPSTVEQAARYLKWRSRRVSLETDSNRGTGPLLQRFFEKRHSMRLAEQLGLTDYDQQTLDSMLPMAAVEIVDSAKRQET